MSTTTSPTRTVCCTIVAQNYLAHARALARSIRKLHPDVDVRTLVVDARGPLTDPDAAALMTLDSPLQFLDAARCDNMAFRYDVTEFSTALKPFYLAHLFAAGYRRVIYFDPDIIVYQPLAPVLGALDNANILLIPHLLEPIPRDGHKPRELDILLAGTHNLGFIGVRAGPTADAFLAWWCERLLTDCRNAPLEGYFVDQRWVDLAPHLFDGVHLLKHPGCDVAYWNLHARPFRAVPGGHTVRGEPLIFFHFTGFNADQPESLSKHQTRLNLANEPDLARLLADYAQRVKAEGYDAYKRRPYGHARFSNGVPIHPVMLRLFLEQEQRGLTFPQPFDADATPGFYRWLNSPVAGHVPANGRCVTNYLFDLYSRRPDLLHAFPGVPARNAEKFLKWAEARAVTEGAIAVLVDTALGRAPAAGSAAPAPAPIPGINLAGYLTTESGVGEAARGLARALALLGAPHHLHDVAVNVSNRRADTSLAGFAADLPHPIDLVCVNADQVPTYRAAAGPAAETPGKYRIGYWWWELPEFPADWHDRFAYFDEIWVGSAFAQDAISRVAPIPVVRMPPVVAFDLPRRFAKSDFDLPADEFTFLYVFDYASAFERKNPLAAVAAFRAAFRPDEPVRLVLKSVNAAGDPANRARLQAAANGLRVTLLNASLDAGDKNGLIQACDAYLSPHRAEGFGLTVAEAMFLEKPVIATAWSGNVDFANANNSLPLRYRLVTLDRDIGPYRAGQTWAEPDVAHAAELMRHVYTHRADAAAIAAHAVAARLHQRLAAIAAALPAATSRSRRRLRGS